MPQMAPMNWLLLMIYFILTLMLLNFIIYPMTQMKTINNNFKPLKAKTLIWKW